MIKVSIRKDLPERFSTGNSELAFDKKVNFIFGKTRENIKKILKRLFEHSNAVEQLDNY